MNTKKIYILAVLVFALFSCCKDDDNDPQNGNGQIIEKKAFLGEWCCIEAGTATVLNLQNLFLSGVVYQKINVMPEEYDIMSGEWTYVSANMVLAENVLHKVSKERRSHSYKVQKVDNISMILRSREYGNEETYYRIVEKVNVNSNENIEIQYIKKNKGFNKATFTSTNSNIATVQSDGVIKGVCGGIAFITVESEVGKVVVMVEVSSRTNIYSAEVLSDIDSILAKYGEPDGSGYTTGNVNPVITYREHIMDEGLTAIQYRYDEKTREVTQIICLYKKPEWYNTEMAFIQNMYYELYTDGSAIRYGLNKREYSNDYCLVSAIVDNQCFIQYLNYRYIISNLIEKQKQEEEKHFFLDEYNFISFIGLSNEQLINIWGSPSFILDNQYAYSFRDNDYFTQLIFDLNVETNIVQKVTISYKGEIISKEDIKNYMESHYHLYREAGTRVYYTSSESLDSSDYVISYDKVSNYIYYEDANLRKK